MLFHRLFASFASLIALSLVVRAETPEAFKEWPADASPAKVGRRLADNWVARRFQFDTDPKRKIVIYPEVCTWYGSLKIAEHLNDSALQDKLVHKYDFFFTPEGAAKIERKPHVDNFVFGIVPLELYSVSKDKRYLEAGLAFADAEWEQPTEDGVTRVARYWIDDMYMITALQVQAYRATKEKRYLDRAALTMAKYLDRLQQPSGLFYHAPDSHFYWSRGNGWIAAGAAELLHDLPADHPHRARILEGAKKMLTALHTYQAKDGLWRQLIDNPDSWIESSGSAMFAFAMIRGVKDGWLDAAEYGPRARSAWLQLVALLDENADLREVCIGTNKGYSVEYYLKRERRSGDLHGQAAMTWCAMALLE